MPKSDYSQQDISRAASITPLSAQREASVPLRGGYGPNHPGSKYPPFEQYSTFGLHPWRKPSPDSGIYQSSRAGDTTSTMSQYRETIERAEDRQSHGSVTPSGRTSSGGLSPTDGHSGSYSRPTSQESFNQFLAVPYPNPTGVSQRRPSRSPAQNKDARLSGYDANSLITCLPKSYMMRAVRTSWDSEIRKDDILTIENVLNQCGTAGGNDRKTWLRNLKNINMGPAEADHFLGDLAIQFKAALQKADLKMGRPPQFQDVAPSSNQPSSSYVQSPSTPASGR